MHFLHNDRIALRPSTEAGTFCMYRPGQRSKGLIGCRAVTFHPHYWWFVFLEDEALGSLRTWSVDVFVLRFVAYPPEDRNALLRRAFSHGTQLCNLRLAEPGKASTKDFKGLADF